MKMVTASESENERRYIPQMAVSMSEDETRIGHVLKRQNMNIQKKKFRKRKEVVTGKPKRKVGANYQRWILIHVRNYLNGLSKSDLSGGGGGQSHL